MKQKISIYHRWYIDRNQSFFAGPLVRGPACGSAPTDVRSQLLGDERLAAADNADNDVELLALLVVEEAGVHVATEEDASEEGVCLLHDLLELLSLLHGQGDLVAELCITPLSKRLHRDLLTHELLLGCRIGDDDDETAHV